MLRGLAYLVHGLRPDWPEASVLTLLRTSSQRIDALVSIAIHAALDPTASTPGVITHRAPCTASAQTTPQPPNYNHAARTAALKARANPDNVRIHLARIRTNLAQRDT